MANKRETARIERGRRRQLGEMIKRFRAQRGLTQRQVADALGKRSSAVCDYEVGRREPPGLVLIDLSVLLDVPATALYQLARAA